MKLIHRVKHLEERCRLLYHRSYAATMHKNRAKRRVDCELHARKRLVKYAKLMGPAGRMRKLSNMIGKYERKGLVPLYVTLSQRAKLQSWLERDRRRG